jgi:hypothetical protein
VLLFIVLLGGVVYAGFWLIRWYAYADWYVGVDHGHLAVYEGRPGGFAWYKPRLETVSAVTTAQILTFRLTSVEHDQEEPTRAAAENYIANLHGEWVATQQLRAGVTPTTVPSATTTTAPAQRSTSTTAAG